MKNFKISLFTIFFLIFFAQEIHSQGIKSEEIAPGTYKAYMVCNAHLDTQWLWDVKTTIDEYLPRTLFQNIYLMERYPDYIFNFEGAVKYKWMKEYYPQYFEKLKKYVANGQWHISGASWDANDPNMPSPESSFRNILLAQELYKKEFGVKSTDIFLPDCFGFGYTLPTIAAHSGLIGMSTQKLSWRYNEFYKAPYHRKNPFAWGLWYGIDGSSILAAFDGGSYSAELPDSVAYNKDIIRSAQNAFDKTTFRYYSGGYQQNGIGIGDRGNSGTITTTNRLIEAINDKNAPVKIISASSDMLFKQYMPFDKYRSSLPSFDGELLMDVHATGCYTSQAAMKYYNRKNEELIGAAEKASVAADWLGARAYDKNKINGIWERFLWHQFHDDLTGTSIPNAYTWSWNDELISLVQSGEVINTASGAISYSLNTQTRGIPVVVYNPVTYEAKGSVSATVDGKFNSVTVYSPDGKIVPSQVIDVNENETKVIFSANVKPVGYAVYEIRTAKSASQKNTPVITNNSLENSIYKIKIDENGDISSIIDKRYNRELVKPGSAFRLSITEGNLSQNWPAWEILKNVIDKKGVSITKNVKISIEEEGAARVSLKVERSFGDSKFVQYIRLTNGASDDRIDIENVVKWGTKDALLKVEFVCNISNEMATYDLGIGSISRGNNIPQAYEVPAHKWADLTDEDGEYGISILNDCKYGWDKPDNNTLRLTLLHTPEVGRNYQFQAFNDQGEHHFTYSILGHKGDKHCDKTIIEAEKLNMPLVAFISPKHQGDLGREFSMVNSSTNQLGIRALKKAEDGNGYIVRCYELTGEKLENAKINFPATITYAEECNAIEERIGDAKTEGNSLIVNSGKFAPKTFRVILASPDVKSSLKIENVTVNLPFNNVGYTTDEFYTYYQFDQKRNSYAAELIPETVDCDGVIYKMGKENVPNVILCKGNVIDLPQGNYNKVYLLLASVDKDIESVITIDDKNYKIDVPAWKGFYGQWGWDGFNKPFMRSEKIGFLTTHHHNGLKGNVSYEYGYMYEISLDINPGAKKIVLPKNENLAIFAVTLSNNPIGDLKSVNELFVHP